MTKHLAIVGCSYTHWHDCNGLFQTYPALIAAENLNYTVYDVSVPGGSNSTAFMRCKFVEDYYNVRLDKVIFQLTHYPRLFVHSNTEDIIILPKLFKNILHKNNYKYTSGHFANNVGFNITTNFTDGKIECITNKYGTKKAKNFILKDITSWRPRWETRQQIELLAAAYDTAFMTWHDYCLHEIQTILDSKNFLGNVVDMLGLQSFRKLSVDIQGHLSVEGHRRLYKLIRPKLKNWL
tara:strand:+ start:491 stop:1201 length:711 start_codon:yes stop_codon:yes gene_type:complete